jgi:replicative DNA helicase
MDRLKGAPVYVDVTPSATIASIRAHARAVGKKSLDGKPLMVVVDYLQLVDGPGQNRELEVSGVARELKKLALDMDVIVLVAAQLNRGQPNRGGVIPAPTLRDLRESGGIEANADGVILLHRDEKKPAFVDFIIAKARQGEVGTVQMRWQPSFARVLDPVSHANEPLFDVGGMQ